MPKNRQAIRTIAPEQPRARVIQVEVGNLYESDSVLRKNATPTLIVECALLATRDNTGRWLVIPKLNAQLCG